MLEEVKKVHPILFKFAGPNCVIHENFVSYEPVTIESVINSSSTNFISKRCIEGVPREKIRDCILNAKS